MKKMLMLVLVLTLSSMAGATMSWSQSSVTVGIGGTTTIQLVSSDAEPTDVLWIGADPSIVAEIFSITALAAAGPDAYVMNPVATEAPGWWKVQSLDFSPPSSIAQGAEYDVVIKGLTAGTYLDLDSGNGGMLSITVVPEPVTIALLGIGGLFLRRKK